jgi:hypothetical protein
LTEANTPKVYKIFLTLRESFHQTKYIEERRKFYDDLEKKREEEKDGLKDARLFETLFETIGRGHNLLRATVSCDSSIVHRTAEIGNLT